MNIDKVKELYVGQEFKNYKIFCKFMGEEPKKANSKISQIKEWCNIYNVPYYLAQQRYKKMFSDKNL